jgi:dolichyl-phosphate beta-glucosyltransferase
LSLHILHYTQLHLIMLVELVLAALVPIISVFASLLALYPLPRSPTDNERYYTDVLTGKREKFSHILEEDLKPSPAALTTDGTDKNNSDHELSPSRRRSLKNLKSNSNRSQTTTTQSEERVQLSVVVPAYNEELRLPSMLNESLDFLENRLKKDPTKTFEILIVDDGSKDKTSEIAAKVSKQRKSKNVRVLTLEKNRGKGGAVTQV